MSNKANFKAFEAAAAELSLGQIKDAIEHLKAQRANAREGARAQRAELKAQLDALTEKRNRGGAAAEAEPKKSKKSKKRAKAE